MYQNPSSANQTPAPPETKTTSDELRSNVDPMWSSSSQPLRNRTAIINTITLETNANTLFELGAKYIQGRVVKQDYKLAFKCFLRAGALGCIPAIYNIGIIYRDGIGVNVNSAEAARYLKQAAEKGYANAQNALAVMILDGTADGAYDLAINWLTRAANQNLAEAQFNLAILYLEGTQISQDLNLAAAWFAEADELNHAESQYMLGLFYLKGVGVIQDKCKAINLFRKAAAQGHTDAGRILVFIESRDKEAANVADELLLPVALYLPVASPSAPAVEELLDISHQYPH